MGSSRFSFPRLDRLHGLMAARVSDQAVLGLASIGLAARLGPEAFAPIGVLFVANSLAIQLSDFGVGFRLLRAAPGERFARSSLIRIRRINAVISAVALIVGLSIGGSSGGLIASMGVLWMVTAESYIGKSGTLKVVGARPVVIVELSGAAFFAAGAVIVGYLDGGVVLMSVVFVVKHLIEVSGTRKGMAAFADEGERISSAPEWIGQTLTYLIANVDFLAVALLLNPADLSRYLIAFRLVSSAPALMAYPLTQDTFVAIGGLRGDEARPVVERQISRGEWMGVFGMIVALTAAPIIPELLGGEWSATGSVMVLLAVSVPWRMLLGVTVAMTLTAGHPKKFVRWELARLGAVVVAVFGAAIWSIEAVAAAVSLTTIVGISLEHRGATRLLGVPVRREVAVASGLALILTCVAGMWILR